MAIKTFVSGEILTASDTNTFLGNSGLVYVTQQTVGTAVASVTVSSAFNTNYDNYVITMAGGQTSASAAYQISFGASTTAYYGSWYYDLYTGAGTGTLRRNNGANIQIGNTGSTTDGWASWQLFCGSPFKTERTTVHGTSFGGGYAGWVAGAHDVAASYTSFVISVSTGTMTGGIITVFGYRKA